MDRNQELKEKIKSKNIKLWEVAEKLGIHDSNFSRILRYQLNDEQYAKISDAIKELESDRKCKKTRY